MDSLFAVEFELQDFGQNVSHLTRKTYYSHDFFTDRQVYAAISGRWIGSLSVKGNLASHSAYQLLSERVPATIAISRSPVPKTKSWFSILPRDLAKSNERVNVSLVIQEGWRELILPGTRFVAFSFEKPPNIMFIGKKGAFAKLLNCTEVDYSLRPNAWTTTDLIYYSDYMNLWGKEITNARFRDASARFLVGEFECSEVLEVQYKGELFRFFSLVLFQRFKGVSWC
ncbi:MAG: hypothetical protein HY675_00070 [Chloroflexi bacterium]|nr:hypothetical protein [Chloroflexota bacterium]